MRGGRKIGAATFVNGAQRAASRPAAPVRCDLNGPDAIEASKLSKAVPFHRKLLLLVNLLEGFFEPNQLSAVIERQESYEMNEAKIARIVGISFGTLWIVIFGLRLLSGT